MATLAQGAPSSRLVESDCLEPNSTRPRSFTRTVEPSGLARTTMDSNSLTSESRPLVWSVIWNWASLDMGWAPMRPTAAWIFWLLIAVMTSVGVIPSAVRRAESSQMRML